METEAAQTGGEEGMVGAMGGRPSKVASVGGGVGRSPLCLPSQAAEEGGAEDRGDVEGGSRGHMSTCWFGERGTYGAMTG
jgi:hypothetical protein